MNRKITIFLLNCVRLLLFVGMCGVCYAMYNLHNDGWQIVIYNSDSWKVAIVKNVGGIVAEQCYAQSIALLVIPLLLIAFFISGIFSDLISSQKNMIKMEELEKLRLTSKGEKALDVQREETDAKHAEAPDIIFDILFKQK